MIAHANAANATIDMPLFIKHKKLDGSIVIEETGDKIPIPSYLRQAGFQGLLQFPKHPELFYIIQGSIQDGYSILEKRCYCSVCKCFKNSDGGNYIKHLHSHAKKKTVVTQENIQIIMIWAITHNISFNALADPEFKKLHDNFISNGMIYKILEEFADKIRNVFKPILEASRNIVIGSDGWSSGNRRLQSVVAYTYTDRMYVLRLKLGASPSANLGAQEIADIINKTINEYQIKREKVISLVSDTCNEMLSVSNKLHLAWDKCYLHIISLLLQKFYHRLPKELNEIHLSAQYLAKSSKFADFLATNTFPELGRYKSIHVGCPTRWGSFIDELQTILKFSKAINTFCEVYETGRKITDEEISILETISEPLTGIKQIITEMEDENYNSNIANVACSFACISNICNDFTERYPSSPLSEAFNYLAYLIDSELFESSSTSATRVLMAALLDTKPRIPDQVTRNISHIKEMIYDEIAKRGLPIPEDSFESTKGVPRSISHFNSLQSNCTLETFLNMRKSLSLLPQDFWKSTNNFSSIKVIAEELFAHIPTSVNSEQWFSELGNVVTDRRGSLTPEHIMLIGFVKGNLKYLK